MENVPYKLPIDFMDIELFVKNECKGLHTLPVNSHYNSRFGAVKKRSEVVIAHFNSYVRNVLAVSWMISDY